MNLQEKMDAIGWAQKEDWREHSRIMFAWILEATVVINQLEQRVRELEGKV